ncbi:hypothetical protein AAMO2058_000381800 [Amorphochlora amoebiformis]
MAGGSGFKIKIRRDRKSQKSKSSKRKDKKQKSGSKSATGKSSKIHIKLESSSVKSDAASSISDAKAHGKPKDPCIVLTFGSAILRIGRAEDKKPTSIPCCVAYRRKTPDAANHHSNKQDSDSKEEKARVSRKRKRDETKRNLERELEKRHKVMNGMEYTSTNCTTTMPGDQNFWTNVESKPSVVVGAKALRIPDYEPYDVYYPLRRGFFNREGGNIQAPRTALYHILSHALSDQLQMSEEQWKKYTILVGIPARFGVKEIQILLDLLFTDLNFQRVFLQYEAVLACFGAGVSSACVVDSGAQKTHVCCVVDGMVLSRTEIHLDYGGDDIDETLLWLLRNEKNHHFAPGNSNLTTSYSRRQVRLVKERHCFFSELDELPVQDSQILIRSSGKDTKIHRFNIAKAALVAPRALFEPSLLMDPEPYDSALESNTSADPLGDVFLKESGYYKYSREARELGIDLMESRKGSSTPKADLTPKASPLSSPSPKFPNFVPGPVKKYDPRLPIHTAITESIMNLHSLDLKAKLAKQVLLVGGSCMFKGIVDALEEELVALIPYKVPGANTVNVILNPKNVDPKDLSWKGGYILSHGDTILDQIIRKKDYNMHGICVLREKTAFPI